MTAGFPKGRVYLRDGANGGIAMKARGIVVMVVAACCWSAAAWATVVETGTTVTNNGQPIAEQTVTVKIKQPDRPRVTQTSTVVRKRTVQTQRIRTDRSGRIAFTYDDRTVDRETATVEFTWYMPGGGAVTREVPLSSIGWGPVDLSLPSVPTPSGSPDAPYTPVRYVGEFAGFYIGGQGSGMAWDRRITERIAGTDIVTNRLDDYRKAGGIGLVGGYDWAIGGTSGLTFGPVASFNYIGQSIDHTFAGGFFIGTHINWNATIGGRLGWQVNDRFLMYATGGVEFTDFDLRSNFTGPVLSLNRTATGWFAGGGVEYSQPDWRSMNGRWAAFGQITYSEFCGEDVRMPAFSPGFDYRVASNQVRATVGVTFRPSWGYAPPPP